ncbi:hypothetical protein FIV42_03220 [Persicimonas caeni]|uniref:Uncharacterized protein n=1 Tax=Persicimonas caeni TaxID=2292766 RepID=A0A4Y6PN99_PERCE|nr:hypothetical protein [Persicimonas caeni]QDG49782.1 hypothetical protein FIV42_03220 [Persicimonas caeni]QED31003.1 hypothetical protein FRD00_03215 [Persicimonas caeni]
MRPDFEQRHVPRVAVAPFYSMGTFSLPADELDEALRSSEEAAIQALEADGFEVVGPRALRQHLAENDAAKAFDEGVLLRSELSNYFEPARDAGRPSLEVATIQKLYKEGKLPAEALLFGEVVYHTRTECRVDPTLYNDHADIAGASQTTEEAGSPCIVSHFQAKLVYAPTGETMWFNRKLLQTNTGEASLEAARANLTETVGRTLSGPEGLRSFGGKTRTAALDSDDEKDN